MVSKMGSLGNIFNIHLNNVFSEELEHLRFPRQRRLNGEECRSAEMKAIFQQKDLVVSHIYLGVCGSTAAAHTPSIRQNDWILNASFRMEWNGGGGGRRAVKPRYCNSSS